jgi:hypothetical protein
MCQSILGFLESYWRRIETFSVRVAHVRCYSIVMELPCADRGYGWSNVTKNLLHHTMHAQAMGLQTTTTTPLV